MKTKLVPLAIVLAVASSQAHAINEQYRKKLERSGCTQVSEMQGCDINKSKEENAKAGFTAPEVAAPSSTGAPGRHLIAKSDSGATVATIVIGTDGKVSVNGKAVQAKHAGGALHFQQGMITYTVHDNPDGESFWMDTDAGTKGGIVKE